MQRKLPAVIRNSDFNLAEYPLYVRSDLRRRVPRSRLRQRSHTRHHHTLRSYSCSASSARSNSLRAVQQWRRNRSVLEVIRKGGLDRVQSLNLTGTFEAGRQRHLHFVALYPA